MKDQEPHFGHTVFEILSTIRVEHGSGALGEFQCSNC